MSSYMVSRDGKQFGPYSDEEFVAYVKSGQILPDDLAWKEGMEQWQPVAKLPSFIDTHKRSFNSYEDLTPELREELKKFQTHTNMHCLECGYTGLMGVTGKIIPWYLTWWILIPLSMVGSLFGLGIIGSIILGAILGFARNLFLKAKATCPSCKKNLIARSRI